MFRIVTGLACAVVACKASVFVPTHIVLHDAFLFLSAIKESLQAHVTLDGSALSIFTIDPLPLDATNGPVTLGIPSVEIPNFDLSGVQSSSAEILQDFSQQISKQLAEQQLGEKSSALVKGLVEDNLIPLVKQKQASIADGFNDYLEANPDLKLSASQYASKFWEEKIVLKTKDTIEFLSRSPLAKNTESWINGIRRFQPPTLSLPDVTPSIPSELHTLDVGKVVNDKFTEYLDSHPKLKMPASQFVVDYYQTEFLPRYESTAEVIGQSPLARGIQQFTSRSSSEVAADLTQSLGQRLQPLTSRLASLGDRIITKLAVEPAKNTFDAIVSTTKSIVASVTTNSGEGEGVTSTARTAPAGIDELALPKLPSLPSDILPAIPTIDVDDLVDAGQSAVAQSVTALGRASSRFGTELAEKGSILIRNTAEFTTSVTNGIGEIFEDVTTILPAKTVQILKQSSTQLPVIAEDAAQTSGTLQSSITDLSNNVQRIVQDTVDRAGQWRFFSDENHWETGFWEQQIKRLVSTSEKIADPEQREKVLSAASQTLQGAQQRFVSQYETARDQFQTRYKFGALLNPSEHEGELDYSRAEQTMRQFNDKVGQLQQQWNQLQNQVNNLLNPTAATSPD